MRILNLFRQVNLKEAGNCTAKVIGSTAVISGVGVGTLTTLTTLTIAAEEPNLYVRSLYVASSLQLGIIGATAGLFAPVALLLCNKSSQTQIAS